MNYLTNFLYYLTIALGLGWIYLVFYKQKKTGVPPPTQEELKGCIKAPPDTSWEAEMAQHKLVDESGNPVSQGDCMWPQESSTASDGGKSPQPPEDDGSGLYKPTLLSDFVDY